MRMLLALLFCLIPLNSHAFNVGVVNSQVIAAEEEGGLSIEGLRIEITNPTATSDETVLYSVAILNADGDNLVPTTKVTPHGLSNDFSDISAGEYTGTASAHSSKDIHLWDNTAVYRSPGTDVPINLYFKTSSAMT